MFAKNLGRGLILVAALVATNSFAAAHAAGEMKAGDMMKMPMIDKDKDGMVSKAEFLEMAGKVFDMKVKEMKSPGDKLQAGHFHDLLRNMMGQ